MAAEQLRELFTVIQGGAEVAIENVETFAPDVSIPGAAELLGKTETVTLGNGAAAEVSQLVTETSATTATTAGVGLLAIEIPNAVVAAVPFLGCFAGMTLYNLAPEFWTNVANNLMQAGETIGGKLRAFVNSVTGAVGFSENALNIIKNALIEAGIYTGTIEPVLQPGQTAAGLILDASNVTISDVKSVLYLMLDDVATHLSYSITNLRSRAGEVIDALNNQYGNDFVKCVIGVETNDLNARILAGPPGSFQSGLNYSYSNQTFYFNGTQSTTVAFYKTYFYIVLKQANNGSVSWENERYIWPIAPLNSIYGAYVNTGQYQERSQIIGFINSIPSEYVQPGAVTPKAEEPISTTYPDLVPWNLPEELPKIFPIEVPVNNPNPTQQEAQNPDNNPEPAPFLDWLLQVLPQPAPNPNPQPEPDPPVDPDPQPVPEPIPVIDPVEIEPDPVDPNKPIPPSPLPIIPDLPTTVDSNAMFTVYAPSISQLNAFGGWLWSNNIIDMLLRIWQNPLEGIIAFQKVYAVPTVGSTSNIIVGYIDSEVPAPIVTSQFVTVNCGTLTVDEILRNATDYPPYTMMHIYLPFIGIVELDCNEFMNGSITVTYHIDVYTGTCLVEVASTRSPDMPTSTIIYTFSGNASQQLPLTSSNFGGALNALVSTVSGVARMGTGGMINKVSGASQIGHSLAHEMIHIAHSGDLSANAGIMALRTPYLIIGRRNSYDANAYNELYGYPANKTVYLGNCSGFTRVKAGFLRSKATEEEKQEIMDLLKKGVIL